MTYMYVLHYRSFVVVNDIWLAPEWCNGPFTCNDGSVIITYQASNQARKQISQLTELSRTPRLPIIIIDTAQQ